MLPSRERRRMEQAVKLLLEYQSMEEFLEYFDIPAEEAILQLYEAGQLDPDKFEEVISNE